MIFLSREMLERVDKQSHDAPDAVAATYLEEIRI